MKKYSYLPDLQILRVRSSNHQNSRLKELLFVKNRILIMLFFGLAVLSDGKITPAAMTPLPPRAEILINHIAGL